MNDKKKLLIFHPALAPYRVDLFNSLSEKFNAVFYFNHKNVQDQKFNQDELIKRCNFEMNYLNSGFELMGRSVRTGIIKIITREKPEIILCSEYSPVTLIVFLYYIFSSRKLKLYTISDDSIDNSINRKGIRAFLRNLITKNIDGVIFPSKEVGDWFKVNISEKVKTFELPIIHNDKVFRNELTDSVSISNKYIHDYNLENQKIILFVGRLVEVKNIGLLIDSVSKLNNDEWILLIVGEGILEEELQLLTRKLNISKNVIFTGRKEGNELLAFFNIANLFVLPSLYEPYGAVVNEALLAGCYVLCSKYAGASVLINSKNGEVFNPDNNDELFILLEKHLNAVDNIKSEMKNIRQNKMPFSFDEKFNLLLDNL